MSTFAELADKLPEHEREHVRELAENVLFMRAKLAETRRGLKTQPVVIPYDNGGGQTGIRANPAYSEYEKLLRFYMSALSELRGILDKHADKEESTESNPLADILSQAEKVLADAG